MQEAINKSIQKHNPDQEMERKLASVRGEIDSPGQVHLHQRT